MGAAHAAALCCPTPEALGGGTLPLPELETQSQPLKPILPRALALGGCSGVVALKISDSPVGSFFHCLLATIQMDDPY